MANTQTIIRFAQQLEDLSWPYDHHEYSTFSPDVNQDQYSSAISFLQTLTSERLELLAQATMGKRHHTHHHETNEDVGKPDSTKSLLDLVSQLTKIAPDENAGVNQQPQSAVDQPSDKDKTSQPASGQGVRPADPQAWMKVTGDLPRMQDVFGGAGWNSLLKDLNKEPKPPLEIGKANYDNFKFNGKDSTTYYRCEKCRDGGCPATEECKICPCYYCPLCMKALDVHDAKSFRPECFPIPKECGWSATPIGSAKEPFLNPMYQMIGGPWASGGAGLYYVASFIKQVALLFSPGLRPPIEPDYFQSAAAYRDAVEEPYPFNVPGSTPNNLAPPL